MVVLALDHDLDPPFVFAPARRGILTDFPSVRVDAHGSVQDHSIPQGFRLGFRVPVIGGFGNWAAAEGHEFSGHFAAPPSLLSMSFLVSS